MLSQNRRVAFRALSLLLLALAGSLPGWAGASPGCSAADDLSDPLRAIVAGGSLSGLRWPNFGEDRDDIWALYSAAGYRALWICNGEPTSQALGLMAAFAASRQKGLNPEDYDASRWASRLEALDAARTDVDTLARFDAALTVNAIRYISALHMGRAHPPGLRFAIDLEGKHYDLPQFLLQQIWPAKDVPAVLAEAEPQYSGYQRTEAALQRYMTLEMEDTGVPLPGAPRPLPPGAAYSAVAGLANRLRLVGDLPPAAVVNANSGLYEGALVDAVRHFQSRHGLKADGNLNQATLRQLNMPFSRRVTQLADALERWRWLPRNFPQPPIAVNIPEFVLRVFSADGRVVLRMNVVVGKAVRHQTPVFAQEMKYIVFRPYWNVPLSITRAEILPALRKDKSYLARHGFEITDRSGHVIDGGDTDDETLSQLQAGKLLVRQKPGPQNALGLVKFIFPNQHNVYLHSTPAPQLFAQSRRDFSHGCVRVEKPVELAAWLLRDQPEWTPENIKAAMESGPDNDQVPLTNPVPVLIVYLTAVVGQDGEVYFFDDIYGHDRSLNAALAKGPPYRR